MILWMKQDRWMGWGWGGWMGWIVVVSVIVYQQQQRQSPSPTRPSPPSQNDFPNSSFKRQQQHVLHDNQQQQQISPGKRCSSLLQCVVDGAWPGRRDQKWNQKQLCLVWDFERPNHTFTDDVWLLLITSSPSPRLTVLASTNGAFCFSLIYFHIVIIRLNHIESNKHTKYQKFYYFVAVFSPFFACCLQRTCDRCS